MRRVGAPARVARLDVLPARARATQPLRCVLVRCPQSFARYVSAAWALPPIGLAYVAAAVRAAGHDVRVIDPTGAAPDRLVPADDDGLLLRRGLTDDEILAEIGDVDVIGFSLMFSQDWLAARRLIQAVREAYPTVTLVGGGEHFTSEPVQSMQDAPLDFVIQGEGEQALCDLLDHLAGSRPVSDVRGCWYRDDAGEPVRTSEPTRIDDITSLPWPAWDLIPIQNYFEGGHMVAVDRGRSLPINATRGCPYRCTFCSSPSMWTTRYNMREPADVVSEIRHYRETYGVTNFEFVDLTAIVRKRWAVEFAQRLIDEDLGITLQIPSGTRSEALDDEVIPLMVRAGCTNITYAPESGDPKVLDRVGKRIKPERMLQSMRTAVAAGCNVKANFIFGFPGESRRSILRSFGFLTRVAVAGVHDISIAPLKPYPGSELFRELQAAGRIPDPLDDDFYAGLVLGAENLPWAMDPVESYVEGMTSRQLDHLRIAALVWFFFVSFARRPGRLTHLVRAVVTGKQESRLDKSLIEMRARIARRRRGQQTLQVGEINPY